MRIEILNNSGKFFDGDLPYVPQIGSHIGLASDSDHKPLYKVTYSALMLDVQGNASFVRIFVEPV